MTITKDALNALVGESARSAWAAAMQTHMNQCQSAPTGQPAPSGVIRRCAGPEDCGAGYCFNGADEDAPEREESNRAARARGWRRVNVGWICPACAARL